VQNFFALYLRCTSWQSTQNFARTSAKFLPAQRLRWNTCGADKPYFIERFATRAI
jgi:hypothetical protein